MGKTFPHRNVKSGGKVVSVAFGGLTALALAISNAYAADIFLGASRVQSSVPDEGGTRTSARWLPVDQWDQVINPSASYSVSTSRSGDIFYSDTVTYSRTDGLTYSYNPWAPNNPVTGSFGVDDNNFPTVGIGAQRAGTFLVNTFGNIVDGNANNYIFGTGVTVSAQSRGSKAYATGTYTVDIGSNGDWSIAINSGAAAGAATQHAIDVNGDVTFDGNATINGDSNARSFFVSGNDSVFNGNVTAVFDVNVNGNDNVFNGTVNADEVNLRGNNTSFAGNVTVTNGLNFLSGVTASMTNGADIDGDVNFGGYNGTLMLSNGSDVVGNITTNSVNSNSGNVIFGGNSIVTGDIGSDTARVRQIDINGNATTFVTLEGMNYVNLVNINSAGNLIIGNGQNGDGLDTTGTVGGRLDFNNAAGSVTLTNLGTIRGLIVSTGGANGAGTAGVANEVNFSQNGTMIGNIGSSATNRIGSVNVGTAAAGVVGMTGDLYATQLNISSSSTLNITGNVTATTNLGTAGVNGSATLAVTQGDVTGDVFTANNGQGVLTLVGGTQTATGVVGTNGARLAAVNAGANSAISNFSSNVFATHLNVTGTGTVNLNGNFTGTAIRYQAAGALGTVNLVNSGTSIDSAVTTATNNTGILTLQAGTQTVTGQIGASGLWLATVNAGASGADSTFDNDIFATRLNVTGTGVVNLNGNFTGNAIHYQGDGTVNVDTAKNINATVTTATDNTGTLTMIGGAQAVSGNVGAAGASLATVNAGANGATSTFNGMVHATTLQYSGDGIVVLNGTNAGSATGGLVGTVNFGTGGTGELQIGDNVNLTTGTAGIRFANANDATMRFNGSSTVTGVVGAAATGSNLANSTLGSIYAGVAGETVTFGNDVHVSGSTFHVSGTGTVNLQGDLFGPLVFDADGTVNVSNGKSIRNDGTAAVGTVTTATNNTGTLNYLGSTTLSNDLGASGAKLKAVNFHSDSAVAAVTQILDKNIYAITTTIGNATTGTTANVTGNVYLGDALTLAAANVTLNTAQQDVARVGAGTRITGANPNTLTFAYSALTDGRLATTATATNATTGPGAITTNGATLNFSVAAQPWAANAGGALNTAAASSIGGGTGTLVMNGNESVNIALLGSLRNNQAHTLINVGTATTAQTGTATDNSYVIDSVLSRNASGDLVVTFSRDAQSYVTKSAIGTHPARAAATRLGTLAANGTSYTTDMQTVLNKLDLDQWGYGNNANNLGIQLKRLAPLNNGAVHLSAIEAGTLALDTVGNRMASLRADKGLVGLAGPEADGRDGQWVKLVGLRGKRSGSGDFDGYSATTGGLVWGADTRIDRDALLGVGLSATNTTIDQVGFREGDGNSIRTLQLAGYGAYHFTEDLYGEGSVSFGRHNVTGHRATALGRTANADFRADQLTVRLGVGYRFVLDGKQTLTPMLNLESARLSSDAFTESGADSLNLKFGDQKLTRNRASLGLRYLTESSTESGLVYRPELMASVYRDNKGMTQDVTAAFAGDLTGQTFSTSGAVVSASGYNLMGAVSFLTSKTSLVQVQFGYDHRDGYSSRSARLNARWDF